MAVQDQDSGYQAPAQGFRTFVILWVSQSISVFGSALTFFSITIWLTQVLYARPEQKPQLSLALSAISLAFALPTLLGAPIAGAWADRHDRKRTMIAMDTANGMLSLVTVALLVTGAMQLWMLIVILMLSATVGAFHGSAFDTSYAMIVPEKQLPRANGMMQTMWSLSGILSPALAATLISLPGLARQGMLPDLIAGPLLPLQDGTPVAIAIDAITFFLAAAVLPFLFIPSPKRTDLAVGQGTKSMRADIMEGALYIWHRRPLLWLLGTFAVANFVSGPLEVFLPLMLKFNLAESWQAGGFTYETALALLNSVVAIGGVLGGVFISSWGGLKRRRVYGVVVPLIISGIVQTVFGLSHWFFLSVAMGAIFGVLTPFMNAHSQTIWQTQTPHELQGRVFAVRRLIAQFTWPFSTALAGVLGGLFDPGIILAVLGAVLALFCIGQMFNPYLLRVEDKAYLEGLAARAVAATQAQAAGSPVAGGD